MQFLIKRRSILSSIKIGNKSTIQSVKWSQFESKSLNQHQELQQWRKFSTTTPPPNENKKPDVLISSKQNEKLRQIKQKQKFNDERKHLKNPEEPLTMSEQDKLELLTIEEKMRLLSNEELSENKEIIIRLFSLCSVENPAVRVKATKILTTFPEEVLTQAIAILTEEFEEKPTLLNGILTERALSSIQSFCLSRKQLIPMSFIFHSSLLPHIVDTAGEFSLQTASVLRRMAICAGLMNLQEDSLSYVDGSIRICTQLVSTKSSSSSITTTTKSDSQIHDLFIRCILLKHQLLAEQKKLNEAFEVMKTIKEQNLENARKMIAMEFYLEWIDFILKNKPQLWTKHQADSTSIVKNAFSECERLLPLVETNSSELKARLDELISKNK